ncbi:MAG: hypothetical protein EOM14_00880 [Clostridia bacterium]|nr:hypothetical protein [Clostridia bacterium]
MDSVILEQLLIKKRQQYVKLIELSDITKQLADAVDRKDEVSVKIMLSMRQAPLLELMETETWIKDALQALPEEEAIRMGELLAGAEASSPEEKALCDKISQNKRLLGSISEMDRRISEKIDKKRSFYNTFRQ